MNGKKYNTLVFDCDGVILDSNKVKTGAFYKATLPYGEDAANKMVAYHVANGGVSRYEKFIYFKEFIVPGKSGPDLDSLLKSFSYYVSEDLLKCKVTPGLRELKCITSNSRWLVASGGDQNELRDLFYRRGLDTFFDGGIFGSPDSKEVILERELGNGNIQWPVLFLGDSKYDYKAATLSGFDFVFLSGWSEVEEWCEWVNKNNIIAYDGVKELISVGYTCG